MVGVLLFDSFSTLAAQLILVSKDVFTSQAGVSAELCAAVEKNHPPGRKKIAVVFVITG